MRSRRLLIALTAALTAVLALTAAPASANPAKAQGPKTLFGDTRVTTAPGIAGALIGAGVVPLPVTPGTGFELTTDPLAATYRFPITGGNPNLAGPSGDILHRGGINFVSPSASLEIGKFDIDLAAGKVFATEINRAPGRIAVLDLDLSGLKVVTRGNATILSGITVKLDPAAAGALNATFGLGLPENGSLVFGSATVTLRS